MIHSIVHTDGVQTGERKKQMENKRITKKEAKDFDAEAGLARGKTATVSSVQVLVSTSSLPYEYEVLRGSFERLKHERCVTHLHEERHQQRRMNVDEATGTSIDDDD